MIARIVATMTATLLKEKEARKKKKELARKSKGRTGRKVMVKDHNKDIFSDRI